MTSARTPSQLVFDSVAQRGKGTQAAAVPARPASLRPIPDVNAGVEHKLRGLGLGVGGG
jgi:hypothetical protein